MPDLTELSDVEEPAWPLVSQAISTSRVSMEVLPVDPAQGHSTLLQLRLTERSWLGAFALNCGGVLLDSGWLRIYGSPAVGPPGLPSLAEVNRLPARFDPAWQPDGGIVVAHDALGGAFIRNGNDPKAAGRPGAPGEMLYFAPDALRFEALEAGYETWLNWFLLDGGSEQLYDNLRWPGWRAETGPLPADHGITFVPYLWTADNRRDLPAARRRALPMSELLGLHRNMVLELDSLDTGFLGNFDD
ncbi:DUF2625 family protein [Streptomyces sp. NPDC048275]|uniref:DUF2625 family protein n=1 Tax=Streptomyces sp. NPDC048275 TaxID=3155629 RepID=UPI0033E37B8B